MIYIVFIVLLGGALLTFFANRISGLLRDTFFLLTILATTVLFFTKIHIGDTVSFTLAGLNLKWGLDAFGWYFSLIVLGLGTMAAFYALSYMKGKDRLGYFYFSFLISILSMLGILMSHDLVSFFIFWEVMTWSSYLIVIYSGRNVQKNGINYILLSALGAYAMLTAIVMVYANIHTLSISEMINTYPQFSHVQQVWLPVLFLMAFSVKAAMMPLHVWAPGAYSDAPMAYTSVFSGALSKMGIYGMVIVFVSMISYLPDDTLFKETFAWLGAITAILGTLWAIAQDDARKLLAYSSIAQLGYIITGVAVGTDLAMLSALFLAALHALFKGTLFMAVGAIERQTGTVKFTEVTGLIRKMPWTFIASLLAIIALAGIPPLGGFVGKWMLYESLINSNHYILVIAIFFASTAAFLYCYKFLFGFFLGQEEKEWENVKEAPALMVLPMLILAAGTLVLGTFPGILLKPADAAMQTLGYASTEGHLWSMSILFNEWGDQVLLRPLVYAIAGTFLFFLIILTVKGWKNTRYVSTKDISSSGEVPLEYENLTFSVNFYQPFLRAVGPVMKKRMIYYYREFGSGMEALFDYSRRIYNGNGQTYAIYVMIFLVIILLFKNSIFG
ncbi:MAG: hypothetical protein GXO83_00315 [Chlorobi bacterium]|nr:hypothetical protein [Chlorobiota bacterium]